SGTARNPSYTGGAGLGTPRDAVEDSHGNIYVSDPDLGVVRRISPEGVISIVAGQPRICHSGPPNLDGVPFGCDPPANDTGDGGSPLRAVLQQPGYLLLDRYDNLYISSPDAIRYVNFGTGGIEVHGVVVGPGKIGTVLRLPPAIDVTSLPGNPFGGPCNLASL